VVVRTGEMGNGTYLRMSDNLRPNGLSRGCRALRCRCSDDRWNSIRLTGCRGVQPRFTRLIRSHTSRSSNRVHRGPMAPP
jgi:hypothetical protein